MRALTPIALTQAALLLAVVGCDQQPEQPTTTTPPPAAGARTTDTRDTNRGTVDADNTARNRRDADTANKTPPDQLENTDDIRITAAIREAIMADDAMSMNAENCKIVTENGVVTLRGPVNSQAEKDAIEAKAKAVAGVVRVVNELEINTR